MLGIRGPLEVGVAPAVPDFRGRRVQLQRLGVRVDRFREMTLRGRGVRPLRVVGRVLGADLLDGAGGARREPQEGEERPHGQHVQSVPWVPATSQEASGYSRILWSHASPASSMSSSSMSFSFAFSSSVISSSWADVNETIGVRKTISSRFTVWRIVFEKR